MPSITLHNLSVVSTNVQNAVAVAVAEATAAAAATVDHLGVTTLLTSQVISVAFYSEHEKSDKFCSEALISAWGSFTCRKFTTRVTHGFTSLPKEVILRNFMLWKIHRPRTGLNPRTSDPVASMITTGPPGSTTEYSTWAEGSENDKINMVKAVAAVALEWRIPWLSRSLRHHFRFSPMCSKFGQHSFYIQWNWTSTCQI